MKDLILVLTAVVLAVGIVIAVSHTNSSEQSPDLSGYVGPERYNVYESVNGVATFYNKKAFASATTTVCAIQSPVNATSTLLLGSGGRFTVSSTSAKAVQFAKATTAYATTTFLFGENIAAGAQGTVVATTTTNDFLFAPGTWLVASMFGGTGVDSPVGSCQAEFKAI